MLAWIWWVIAAGVLAIAETLSLDLILIMCAGAALVAALVAGLGGPIVLQFIIFSIVALSLLFVVRPLAKRHLIQGPANQVGIDALIGQSAVVLNQVDQHGGLVKLSGETWSAQSCSAADILAVGEIVQVIEIKGAIARVGRKQ